MYAYSSYTRQVNRPPQYLMHYGIEGMHWGVRRFQNADGSVKPAGAQRYYSEYGDNYHRSDDPKNKPGASETDKKKGSGDSKPEKKGMSEKTKKRLKTAAKVGAAFAATAAAAYTIHSVKQYKDIQGKVIKDYQNEMNKGAKEFCDVMLKSLKEGAERNGRKVSQTDLRIAEKKYKDQFMDMNRDSFKRKAKETTKKAYLYKKSKGLRNMSAYNRAFDKKGEYDKYL